MLCFCFWLLFFVVFFCVFVLFCFIYFFFVFFLRLMCPMLPNSLDCPFLTVPSASVYLCTSMFNQWRSTISPNISKTNKHISSQITHNDHDIRRWKNRWTCKLEQYFFNTFVAHLCPLCHVLRGPLSGQ